MPRIAVDFVTTMRRESRSMIFYLDACEDVTYSTEIK